jgi:ribA/ribD-fused uncharacterized protein
MADQQPILEFFGENRFLSNFYPAEFVWDGIVWPTSEHAYQAAKVHDREERLRISRFKTPSEAKKVGKHLELREDWNQVRYDIMLEIVRAKFTQNPHLKAKLLATGGCRLEEGNHWGDRIWGVSPAGSNNGLNWLGEILMIIREELR